jgi:hypothetical protein
MLRSTGKNPLNPGSNGKSLSTAHVRCWLDALQPRVVAFRRADMPFHSNKNGLSGLKRPFQFRSFAIILPARLKSDVRPLYLR